MKILHAADGSPHAAFHNVADEGVTRRADYAAVH